MRIVRRFQAVFALLLLCVLPAPALFAELSPLDKELLTKIERASIQYFVRMSDKETGLTRDSSRPGAPASIAATGFSLAAVAIAADRGWIPRDQAKRQLTKTLRTLLKKAEHERGFFYHFLDPRRARRVWGCEASSIDTALLVAGALFAGQHFPGTPIETLARKIYERVDWEWMLNGTLLVSMGWTPEEGFLPYYWDTYNEHLILQALAIGSPTHPVPAKAWEEWVRHEETFEGKEIVYSHSGSLFTYQFPHAYIDFRSLNDRGINYFENSRRATEANFEYALMFKDQHQSYSENSWGISASLGPGGYRAYGAKPGQGLHDGTIAPYAAVASIVFTPEKSMQAIRFFYENYQEELYGMFGFKDAFNRDKNWWSPEYLGIDQGISVLMLENYLNEGAVWKKFMALEAVKKWVERCGLSSSSVDRKISSSPASQSQSATPVS